MSYTQFKRLWQYVTTRTTKERAYYKYEDGTRVKHIVTPILGETASRNPHVTYSLDFEVTPHQLRHTYITNLIHASVDPKTVQYLAGHENSRITMDIYQSFVIGMGVFERTKSHPPNSIFKKTMLRVLLCCPLIRLRTYLG